MFFRREFISGFCFYWRFFILYYIEEIVRFYFEDRWWILVSEDLFVWFFVLLFIDCLEI